MELLIVVAIILVIASIAIPKLDQMRMYTQEMAAIRQIGTVHQAMTQYYSQFGQFPTTLQELGPGGGGEGEGTGAKAANLIPDDLAKGEKNGYRYEVKQTPTGYAITAIPVAYNNTGRRTFYSDQSMVIRENWGADPATAESPAIK